MFRLDSYVVSVCCSIRNFDNVPVSSFISRTLIAYPFHMNYLHFLLFIAAVVVTRGNVHGGTFLAMVGKDSVVLAADSRFTSYRTGSMFLGEHERNVCRIGSKTIIGLFGLDSDAHDIMSILREKVSEHIDTDLEPPNIAHLLSNILYSKQLMCVPIVIGLNKETPYLCSMDSLGAQTVSESFVVTGTGVGSLFSICEGLFIPNMSTFQLIDTVKRALKLALQRDVLSGCKVRLYLLHNATIACEDFESDDV